MFYPLVSLPIVFSSGICGEKMWFSRHCKNMLPKIKNHIFGEKFELRKAEKCKTRGLNSRWMSCDELIQYQWGARLLFRTKKWGYIEEHWYWTSLTTRRDLFLSFRDSILNLLLNFFLFLNFLIFGFSPSLFPSLARNCDSIDFSKWSSKRATRTLDSDTIALASWHFQPYKSRSFK